MTGRGVDRRTVIGALAGFAASARPLAARTDAAGPRIACLDYSMAETLVALGHPPIGVVDIPGYHKWVVEPALPPSVHDLGSRYEPNMELMAALRPDLVFTIPYQEPLRPLAERVAPTQVFDLYNPDGAIWERALAATRQAALRIGRPEAGEGLIASVDAALDAVRRDLEPLRLPPVTLLSLMDARHARVYGRMGLFQAVLERIGLSNGWTGASSFWGFGTVGLEDLAGLGETRLLVVEPLPEGVGADIFDGPLWGALPAARRHPPLIVPPVMMFGALPSAVRCARLVRAALLQEPTGE